jgi:hypothetical protein
MQQGRYRATAVVRTLASDGHYLAVVASQNLQSGSAGRVTCTLLANVCPLMRQVQALLRAQHLVGGITRVLLRRRTVDRQSVDEWCMPDDHKAICAATRVNDLQEQAIRRCCARQKKAEARVVLIQGPPGSGKTTTICALLSCLLHGTRSEGRYAAHRARREAPKMLCVKPGTGCVEHFRPHWQCRVC